MTKILFKVNITIIKKWINECIYLFSMNKLIQTPRELTQTSIVL
jgi:hypothetical protein